MKEFIQAHCLTKTQKINPNINDDTWWSKRGLDSKKEEIIILTSFLPADATLRRRFYHILNDLYYVPVCKYCNNGIVSWYTESRYLDYCCQSCSAKATVPVREQLSLARYGVKNPSQSDLVKLKSRDSNLSKFGVDNFSKTDAFSKLAKESWSDKPVEEKEKIKHKRKTTCIDKYGSTTPLTNALVKDKSAETLFANYGVMSPLQSAEIKERRRTTMNDLYGCDEWTQQHLSAEVLANLESKEWLELQMLTKSIRELSTEIGMSYSNLCKIVNKFDLMPANYSSCHQEIIEYLSSFGAINIIKNDRTLLQGKEIDIYLPDFNLAIECNGIYWHSELSGKKDRNYHLHKTLELEKQGIQLLHIIDIEWYDSVKNNIVRSKIQHIMNRTKALVSTRKCSISLVTTVEENAFLRSNHLQSYSKSSLCLGLYDSNRELVSLMSFSKPRYTKQYQWELLRFCNKVNTRVPGAFSKLFDHFTRTYSPTSLISYCDRRWSVGSVYQKAGFTLMHSSSPAAHYHSDCHTLQNRMQVQKHKLATLLAKYDETLTAWQNLKNNKYDRIWDCGNLVYSWQATPL